MSAGEEVEISLELDTEPRVVEVLADLAAALDADPPARAAFDALSYSLQRRHVLAVEGARTAPTRERRIANALQLLRGGGQS